MPESVLTPERPIRTRKTTSEVYQHRRELRLFDAYPFNRVKWIQNVFRCYMKLFRNARLFWFIVSIPKTHFLCSVLQPDRRTLENSKVTLIASSPNAASASFGSRSCSLEMKRSTWTFSALPNLISSACEGPFVGQRVKA